MLNTDVIRADFPILSTKVHKDVPLVYLDSAATSQKPKAVLDAIIEYYQHNNANVHRGVHELGDRATRCFKSGREYIAHFFGAQSEELVLTRNATEALNFVAYTWGETHIGSGDTIIATTMDHHSNLVPWQELARRKGAKFQVVPLKPDGTLEYEWLKEQIHTNPTIKLIAFPHVSNTLGTRNDIQKIVSLVRLKRGNDIAIVVDGAQAAPHMSVSFDALDVDFYAVSAHKMLGPMGIGGVLVKRKILETLQPWLFGGGMIGEVYDTSATFANDIEDRFTAGTPDVAGVIGWAKACEYLSDLGMDEVEKHNQAITAYALEKLAKIPSLSLIGPLDPVKRCGSVAFVYQGVHAHDVAQVLDSQGIAVRSGHHCTMPLHASLKIAASTRASFNVYTTTQEIDALVVALEKVKSVFGK